jgi:hypothetical protein
MRETAVVRIIFINLSFVTLQPITVNVAPDLKKVENPCLNVPSFPF